MGCCGEYRAVRALAWVRAQAGDPSGAEARFRQAADQGDTLPRMHLAQLRERSGDLDGAEALYREAADHGEAPALMHPAPLCEQLGDSVAAERIRCFGLTNDGPPGWPVKLPAYELVRPHTTLSVLTVGSMPSGGRRDK